MPKVTVKATPAPNIPGRWALGSGPRQKLNPDGSLQKDANGNPLYWPARNGAFFASGQDVEMTITDEELKDLQSGANAQLFAVVVTDPAAQPDINEGGSSMAQNQPGSTVPPGTTPQPTPAPAPAPPSPGTPTPAPAPAGTPAPAAEPAQPKKASK